MIRFNILRSKNLFNFITHEELSLKDPKGTVDLFSWTRVTKKRKTGEILVLKRNDEDTPYRVIDYMNLPLRNLSNSKPSNINALVFQNSEDMERFEELAQNNMIEISEEELNKYETSPEYEALDPNSVIIFYND